ncbi:MAG: SDR family oxidoreductase [Rubricoccaceae bacterium]|nr:SDR family oxidoreductase [Rubricoccaceae bacterium]
MPLSGNPILVTGAGGRLGRVVIRQLLEAGARVVGLDAERPEGLPEGVEVLTADLTDEPSVRGAFDTAEQAVGAPHALVHTVGMWAGTPFADTPLEGWQRVLDVNLTTAFLCFREAARRMTEGGRLVAIASRQGVDGGVAEQAAYSAAKAGVVRLVEAVAAEYEGRITAAAVAPSKILFGSEGDGARGVPAEAVASLCVSLCGAGGAIHNGTVLRAYGTG